MKKSPFFQNRIFPFRFSIEFVHPFSIESFHRFSIDFLQKFQHFPIEKKSQKRLVVGSVAGWSGGHRPDDVDVLLCRGPPEIPESSRESSRGDGGFLWDFHGDF